MKRKRQSWFQKILKSTVSAAPLVLSPDQMELIPYNAAHDVVRHHAFIRADDEDDVCGTDDGRLACTQVISCGGGGDLGVLMRGLEASEHPHAIPKFDRRTVVDIATSAFATAVVTETGEVYVSGLNDDGQLVAEDAEQQVCGDVPRSINHLSCCAIVPYAGTIYTSIGRKSSHSENSWCWMW